MAKELTKLHVAQSTTAAPPTEVMSPPSIPVNEPAPEPGELQDNAPPRVRFAAWAPQIGRVLWILVAITAATVFIVSLPVRYTQFAAHSGNVRVGLDFPASDPAYLTTSPEFYAGYNLALEVAFALIFFVVALVIFWRARNDTMALLASLALLTFGTTSVPTIWPLAGAQTAWYVLAMTLYLVGWFSIAALVFLFPDGRFAPRWTLWVFVLFAAHLLLNLFPTSPFAPHNWPVLHSLFNLVVWGSGVYSLIYKYRHVLGPVQRQQTKWVVFGMAVGVLGALAATLPAMLDRSSWHVGEQNSFHELVHVPLLFAFLALIPLSIGVSIVHYRLWDIDIIINRTLVYLPLTGILAGLFSALMVVFQKLFLVLTGEKSDAAVALTTLVLASVFTPAKEKVQGIVNKYYQYKPDPAKKLKEFNKQMESFIELNDVQELTRRALAEAATAFSAKSGEIYLQRNGQLRLACTFGGWIDTGTELKMDSDSDANPQADRAAAADTGTDAEDADDTVGADEPGSSATIRLPLQSGAQCLGLLHLGPRRNGAEYEEQDSQTLQQTAELLARTILLSQGATATP